MKRRFPPSLTLVAVLSLGAVAPVAGFAIETAQPAGTQVVPVQPRLPYGVEDVVKLNRAKVGEEVIVAFIQNSGTAYGLRSEDILYLHDQGVSDSVIKAMLDKSKRVAETRPPQAPAYNPPPQPAVPPAPMTEDYVQPAYTEPASSLYVIPYQTAAYPYSYSYPYYSYPYYGYGYYGGLCSWYYPWYCRSYGYYGHHYPYNHGYGYNHGHGLVATHAGFGGHGSFSGHSGFVAHSGSFSRGGGVSGGHMGGGGGHVSVGHMGGGRAGGGGGHMGGGHR